MKTKLNKVLTLGVLAGFTVTWTPAVSFANDGENQSNERPENIAVSPEASASAWVGVYTVPLPDVVSEHVGLEDGQGVMVEAVLAGSPAEKAELVRNDIITHADSEVIAGAKSLSKLVASKKAGDKILLNVRRKNESLQVEVQLEPKPEKIALSGHDSDPLDDLVIVDDPIDQRLEIMLQQMEDDFDRGIAQALDNQMRAVARMKITPGNGVHQRTEFSHIDKNGHLTVLNDNGNTTVKLKDKDGKVLFEGPYNTEEDKNAVPEDLRKKIEAMRSGNATMLWVCEGFRNTDDQDTNSDSGKEDE